jgi:hypothetical protein
MTYACIDWPLNRETEREEEVAGRSVRDAVFYRKEIEKLKFFVFSQTAPACQDRHKCRAVVNAVMNLWVP